jgi:hypothetical protein
VVLLALPAYYNFVVDAVVRLPLDDRVWSILDTGAFYLPLALPLVAMIFVLVASVRQSAVQAAMPATVYQPPR